MWATQQRRQTRREAAGQLMTFTIVPEAVWQHAVLKAVFTSHLGVD